MGGEVVRLEVPNEMPQDVVEMLMTGLSVEEEDLYVIDGPLGLDDLFGLDGTTTAETQKPNPRRSDTGGACPQSAAPGGGGSDQNR